MYDVQNVYDRQNMYADNFAFHLSEDNSYVSAVLDSGRENTVWGRMTLNFSESARHIVSVGISNHKDGLLESKYNSKYSDILLFHNGSKGRYLQFTVTGNGDFYGYCIYYPVADFTRYLPQIYHGNEQLMRFMSVFSESYLDMEHEIDSFYRELNPTTCKVNNLPMLARLVGGEVFLAAEDLGMRRRLLKYATLLNQWRGTANAIKLITYLVVGEVPFVREDGNTVDVMLRSADKALFPFLERLLQSFVPYPMKARLICYCTEAVLDRNAYIGYCCCAEKKRAIVGRAVLGELLCI